MLIERASSQQAGELQGDITCCNHSQSAATAGPVSVLKLAIVGPRPLFLDGLCGASDEMPLSVLLTLECLLFPPSTTRKQLLPARA
jgi:hypothetical protein